MIVPKLQAQPVACRPSRLHAVRIGIAALQFFRRCPGSNNLFARLQPQPLQRPRAMPMLGRAATSAVPEATP